jgi:hypothetical protein
MYLLFVCEYILWCTSLSIDDRRRVRLTVNGEGLKVRGLMVN